MNTTTTGAGQQACQADQDFVKKHFPSCIQMRYRE